jgi:hypothetical protein
VSGAFKRFVLWEYQRGVWQYDLMCAVILVFVLLTPREWFRDQPRIPNASQVVSLPGEGGQGVFWIEPEMVGSVPEAQRIAELSKVLTTRTGKRQNVNRIEPIFDSEHEIKGYMAFARQ